MLRKLADQRSRTAFSLLDQIFVSGTTFVTAILVGRYCSSEELGQFALAISFFIFASGTQTSLITAPYTVFRAHKTTNRRQFAKTAFSAAVSLCALLCVLCIPIAIAIVLIPSIGANWTVAIAMLVVLPCYLAREFGRRFEFARMRMHQALRLDVVLAVLQLGFISCLAVTEQLDASRALLCIGAACGISSTIWYFSRRTIFVADKCQQLRELNREWNLGKWLFVDHAVCFLQMYVMHWLLSIMLSSSATGILAACTTIASLGNPFIQGAGNYLAPRFAETVGTRSKANTISLYWKSTFLLASVVAAFTLVIVVFGEEILRLLYRDQTYADYAIVLVILSLRLLCSIPTIAADHAITAMEAPKVSVVSTIAGLVVTIVCGIPLLIYFDVLGAAIAILVGTATEAIVLLGLFYRRLAVHHWVEPE